jgi:hypothetical protein
MLKFGLLPDTKTKNMTFRRISIDRDKLPHEYNILDKLNKCISVNRQLYNDCTANSIQKQIEITSLIHNRDIVISVLYQYYNSRLMLNNFQPPTDDDGCSFEVAFDSLKLYLFVDNDLWNYKHNVNETPLQEVYQESNKNYNIIVEIEKIFPCIDVLKHYIANNMPIVCGIAIYNNFCSITKDNNILYLPNNDINTVYGYHAILLVGYNTKGFIVLNSHGENFGDKGLFVLSFDYPIIDPYIIRM